MCGEIVKHNVTEHLYVFEYEYVCERLACSIQRGKWRVIQTDDTFLFFLGKTLWKIIRMDNKLWICLIYKQK